jgi:hypothetical protein
MSTSAFKPGDTVYSDDGREAEFVAKAGGEYVVRPIYEDEDGPQFGDIQTWPAIFRTPPAPKLDAQTAAAEKRLADVTDKVRELEAAKRVFEADEKSRLERIKQHEQLAELDRYLAGEMTHYVAMHEYYPDVEVIPVGETVESYSSSSGYGLLTLCPRKHWDKKIYWTVTYKAPSPDYSRTKTVIPCCGEDAAKAKAREVLRGYLDQYQAEPNKRHYAEMLAKSCQKWGIEVPAWLSECIASSKRAALEKSAAEHRKKLAEAEDGLVALAMSTGQNGGAA